MSNYVIGHNAEKQAAEYLKSNGFKIRNLNWKTRICEIDIIAEKDGRIYFVEVKFRQSADQGIGLEYITPRKLKQMQFAAEIWVQNHDWPGEYQLAVISMDDEEFTLLEDL